VKPLRTLIPAVPSEPANRYARWLRRRIQAGCWTPSFQDISRRFGPGASCLISHVASAGKLNSEAGWVLATESFITRGLGIDADAQDAILRRLERAGIAEVRVDGRARYVRLDLDRLEETLAGPMPR
jgi:hypothetical protein